MVTQLHPKGGSFFIMYLSRRRGIYYLWYVNDEGKRQKVSTGATRKSEALKFLTQFNQRNHERKRSIAKVGLPDFSKAYIEYAKSVLSPNSIHSIKAAFNWLSGMYGDIQLADIHAREVDAFVSDIRREGPLRQNCAVLLRNTCQCIPDSRALESHRRESLPKDG